MTMTMNPTEGPEAEVNDTTIVDELEAKIKRRKWAVLGCSLPIVAIFLVGLVSAGAGSGVDHFALGRLVGQVGCFMVVPSALGGLAIYKGWPRVGWTIIAITILVMVALAFFVIRSA